MHIKYQNKSFNLTKNNTDAQWTTDKKVNGQKTGKKCHKNFGQKSSRFINICNCSLSSVK